MSRYPVRESPKQRVVTLPTFHAGQVSAFNLIDPSTGKRAKRIALRAGRRWGKTKWGIALGCDAAIKGKAVGWFAPEYKFIAETFGEMASILAPVKTASSRIDGVIRTMTGGRIDFWSLDNELAGRSRFYHLVIVDEAAYAKNNLMHIWQTAIEPTLFDYDGDAYVISNTNGVDPDNFMYQICTKKELGWTEYHAPTSDNPLIPIRKAGESVEDHNERRKAAIDKIRSEKPPLVFKQEYLAEFVDWSGIQFFAISNVLDATGQPYPYPNYCDAVFAVIDTAVKAGSDNDGTAVTYFAISKDAGPRLLVLDWDILQIEGDLLQVWLPTVMTRCEQLSRQCNARMGVLGTWIEDVNSGAILLQQAGRSGLNAHPIDSKLTAAGKDGRALNVSGYVYQGLVKLSEQAYNKITVFKGTSRNHFMSQVFNFRIGDKDAAKRADDLLDTFCYGIAIALGNSEGY